MTPKDRPTYFQQISGGKPSAHYTIVVDGDKFQTVMDAAEFLRERILNIEARLTAAPLSQWLTEKEVAEKLQVSRRQLLRLRTSGQLHFTVLAGKIFYQADDIDALMMRSYTGEPATKSNQFKKDLRIKQQAI